MPHAMLAKTTGRSSPGLPARLVVPPMPPQLHRRLYLSLQRDGIAIDPSIKDGTEGLLFEWTGSGRARKRQITQQSTQSLPIAGILGVVTLWDASYLFVILPSASTATLPGSTDEVYTVQGLAAVPLVQERAAKEVEKLQKARRASGGFKWPFPRRHAREDGAVSDGEDEESDLTETSLENDHPPSTSADPPTARATRRELEAKIISQILREYGGGGFFYSYSTDLTRTIAYKRNRSKSRLKSADALAELLNTPDRPKEDKAHGLSDPIPLQPDRTGDSQTTTNGVEPDIHIPLWRRADKRFFWNEHLLKDLIDSGFHSFILPVMQGWVQTSLVPVSAPITPTENKDTPIQLCVISRRSKDRAGLRYQRRGIDDQGHVANFVETEMIVRAEVEGKVSTFSYVQIRGSIPLKWSQQPWSMKPPPVLDQPVDKTFSVANLHFDDIVSRYGPITAINLSEQNGKEGAVTQGYGELLTSLDRKDVTYKPFDFHAKCKGMKWENISELTEELDFDSIGYTWVLDRDVVREQKGAFRSNCIDCLDRTNVVQSAIARKTLSLMLAQLGLASTGIELERAFNDTWANNGDTISLCYAHTSALKGDFVRTGKRDISGMLHDGVSSLSRMFYGAVSDFFAQTVISFMLGHRNLSVFSEFLENMTSSDASNLIQLSRVRAAAIETCSARVLDGEQRLAGWTVLSPQDPNVKLSATFEEKVLLLTESALFIISFNYPLDKVVGFTRVPLLSITGLQRGAYISSPLQESARDATENAGFMVRFTLHEGRYSTYSIQNRSTPSNTEEFIAFKVLPREFVARGASSFEDQDIDSDSDANPTETCQDVAVRMVKRVVSACSALGNQPPVIEEDVVSVAEAEAGTSIAARIDYAVKRLLWL